jgi:tetratricopeptide (TPR) repeat protein
LKEKIKKEIQPDYLLIDSRTGITEIAGITLSLLADEVVLLSVNNEENLEGTQQVLRTILQNNNPVLGTPPKIHFVMSRIPLKKEGQTESPSYKIIQKVKYRLNKFLTEKELDYQIDKVLTIHSEPELQIEESLKIAYDDEDRPSAIGMDYLRLFRALTDGDLTKEEEVLFRRKREFEKLKVEIFESSDRLEKIKLLERGLEQFKDLDELYIVSLLGEAYYYEDYFLDEWGKAEVYLKRTIELEPNYLRSKLMLANMFYVQGELDKTCELYLDVYNQNTSNEYLIRRLGAIYILKKDYERGLQFFNTLLTEFSPSGLNYNAYASSLMRMGNYKEALEYSYKSLELEPSEPLYNAKLAEIQGHLGNNVEFYRSINMALSLGFRWGYIEKEPIYQKYLKEQRFIEMLARYDIYPEEEI